MNKDKVRKYISDIQIAMGKILEEMDGLEEVAKSLTDEKKEITTNDFGIPDEEINNINDILSKTTLVKEELSEEEMLEQIARECGIDNFVGDNITDLQEVVLEKLEDKFK